MQAADTIRLPEAPDLRESLRAVCPTRLERVHEDWPTVTRDDAADLADYLRENLADTGLFDDADRIEGTAVLDALTRQGVIA